MTAADLISTVDAAGLINAMCDQKDAMRVAINKAEDADQLNAVSNQLAFVSQVWKACRYGYKVDEIVALIRDKAERIKRAEVDFLQGLRKNASCRNSTLHHIEQLNKIIGA